MASSSGGDPHFSLQLHPKEPLRRVINRLGWPADRGDRSTKASARLSLQSEDKTPTRPSMSARLTQQG